MSGQQLIEEIRRLPIAERIALMDAISRGVQEDLERDAEASRATGLSESSPTQSASTRMPLSQRLRGIVKFDGAPPNDEEMKDMIADYLTEKYS